MRSWRKKTYTDQLTPDALSDYQQVAAAMAIYNINPPWTLANTLTETMPILTKLLALDESANYQIEHQLA